jgi:hypothetical protein
MSGFILSALDFFDKIFGAARPHRLGTRRNSSSQVGGAVDNPWLWPRVKFRSRRPIGRGALHLPMQNQGVKWLPTTRQEKPIDSDLPCNRALSPLPPYGLTQTVWARSLSVNVLQSGEAVTVSPGPQHPLGAIFHLEGLPAIGNIVVVQVPLVI